MLFGDSTYRQTRKQFLMETFPFWGGNSGAKIAVSLLGPLLLRRLAELTEPHHAAKLGAAGRESLLPQSYLLAGAARAVLLAPHLSTWCVLGWSYKELGWDGGCRDPHDCPGLLRHPVQQPSSLLAPWTPEAFTASTYLCIPPPP